MFGLRFPRFRRPAPATPAFSPAGHIEGTRWLRCDETPCGHLKGAES